MTRLSRDALAALPRAIIRPGHDPRTIGTGIVHFGPGAFHRAHQAHYVDRLLDHDLRWGIVAVSLRSGETVEALAAQDRLYTLAVTDRDPSLRIVAAHSQTIGPRDLGMLGPLLADPAIRVVTSTVTEKGYCLAADGTLDLDAADIRHDLARPEHPHSLIGWVAAALGARRAAGVAPFAMLCCDNLADNGVKLGAAVASFARQYDPGLASWIEDQVAFPNSMVDSITPASDGPFLASVAQSLGMADLAAVKREQFVQWVVQPTGMADGPDLASVGVTVTDDVRGYERAKLRILNGPHSSIAYLGLAMGHETVADAMADARLATFIERMTREDIVPGVGTVAGLDLQHYASDVLDRFRNPAVRHLLSQIAWDGSKKLPYRLFDTILDAREAGRPIDRLAIPVAAWMRFIAMMTKAGADLVDPLADRLKAAAGGAAGGAALVEQLLAIGEIFPATLAQDKAFRTALTDALEAIERRDWHGLLG